MEHKGVTIWFTGLPGSGKSTLADALRRRFIESGMKVEVIDGDDVRKSFSIDLGYSKRDRNLNITLIGFVAKMLTRNGVVAIAAAISPYREARDLNRITIGDFVEVYCNCPLDVLEQRDPKGLYSKARRGELKAFTGIDDPYEEPLAPEVIVQTDRETIAESADKIWLKLRALGYVPTITGAVELSSLPAQSNFLSLAETNLREGKKLLSKQHQR
jgi:adenylylsulfate kinase